MITIKKFSRNGCFPCSVLSVYLGEIDLAAHNAELVEIDVTEQSEVISQYDLKSVPVLVFERNGVEVARLNGLVSPQEIVETIEHAKRVK